MKCMCVASRLIPAVASPLQVPISNERVGRSSYCLASSHALKHSYSTGTYSGVVERLDYIESLGINAIELLPIHEYNELEYYQVAVLVFGKGYLWQPLKFCHSDRSYQAQTATGSIFGATPRPPSLPPWRGTALQRQPASLAWPLWLNLSSW